MNFPPNSSIVLLSNTWGKALDSGFTKYIVPYSKNNETLIAVISAAILEDFRIGLYATRSMTIPIIAQDTIDISSAPKKFIFKIVISPNPIKAPSMYTSPCAKFIRFIIP